MKWYDLKSQEEGLEFLTKRNTKAVRCIWPWKTEMFPTGRDELNTVWLFWQDWSLQPLMLKEPIGPFSYWVKPYSRRLEPAAQETRVHCLSLHVWLNIK